MDQSFDILRRKVLQAVDEQRSLPKTPPRGREHILAEFIHLHLVKLGMSEAKFTQSLNLPDEQVRLLLQAMLPDQMLTNDLLQRIATVLGCESNLLYIMLNRPVSSSDSNPILTESSSDDAISPV